jgi:Protein of unknown function (DUF3892)
MAQNVQITCINKSDRLNPHERILNVGGQGWKMSQPQAIIAIEAGTYQFWVHRGGRSVWVVVATSQYGNKYLKTQDDNYQPDNLLSLPECP